MKKLHIKLKRARLRKLRLVKPHIKKGWLIFGIVSAAMCLCAVFCAAEFKAAGNMLKSQSAAGRWAGESGTGYAQVSFFAPTGGSIDEAKIMDFRQKVKTATADTLPKTVKNYMTDAWSTAGSVNVSGRHGSSSASVIAVGGNYFYFHPLDLVSGGYFSDSDLMNDRVVLDEELAWKIYGGIDLAGLTVTINNRPFIVAGVVKREDDFADKAAYGDNVGLYMSFDAYNSLLAGAAKTPGTGGQTPPADGGTQTSPTGAAGSAGTGTASGTGTETAPAAKAAISCYEAVLPNQVKGYAASLMMTELNAGGAGEVVENSSRYDSGNTWNIIKSFGKRAMRGDTVIYPYWENAARLVENRCALYMLLEMIFWLCPAVFVFIMLIKLYKYAKGTLRVKYLDLKDRYENRTLFHGMKGSDDNGGTEV